MSKLKERVVSALSNESGGPSVEQIIGIAVAITVGVGFYLLGGKMFSKLGGAGDAVDGLEMATATDKIVN